MKNKSKYIIYLFPILAWMIVYFGFSFDGLYGQDAYEYLRYTEALKTFLVTGKSPGDYFWGVYYPVFGSVLSFIIPNIALSLQLISVISLVVTAIYLDKIIRLIYKENGLENIPFLFFTLSPIILIHSVLTMSDLLTCCFITIAIYSLLQFLETAKNKYFLIGITCCIFSILTRYAAGIILFPICFMVLLRLLKTRNYKLLLLPIPIAVLVALPHVFIRAQNSLQFLSHQWLQTWAVFNLFRSDFMTVEGESHHHFINLIYIDFSVLHPIFLFIGVILIAFLFKEKSFELHKYQKLILISILIYALFLGGIPFQNKRFLILSFPLVIAFLFPLIKELFTILKHRKLVVISIVFIQISLGIYFGKKFYDRNLLEKTISKEMKQYEGKTLYSFDIDIALQGRKVALNYKSLYVQKYSHFEKNALILINEKAVTKQWKGKNPFINWNSIQKKCVLIKLETYNEDWNLYQIQSIK